MDKRTYLGIFLIFSVLIGWSLMLSNRTKKGAEDRKLKAKSEEIINNNRETKAISGDGAIPQNIEQINYQTNELFEVLDTVDTELFRVVLSRIGASVKSIKLKKYEGVEEEFVELVPEGEKALTSIVGDVDLRNGAFALLERNGNRLIYELISDNSEATKVRKVYEFNDSSYIFGLEIDGVGERHKILWGSGLRTTEKNPGMEFRYFGGIVELGGTTIFKNVGKLDTIPKGEQGTIKWIGIKNKYFLAAIVPLVETDNYALSRAALGSVGGGGGCMMRGCAPTGNVDTEATKVRALLSTWSGDAHKFKVYLGPLDYDILRKEDYGLENACYFGFKWIRPISRFFLKVILALYKIIPNYGIVIIMFSFIISFIFFPLTKKSQKSAMSMQNLQPKMAELKKKHKNDSKKLNQATMDLYRKQGVNPVSGCLPIFIQMPVFFALYAILDTTIALRGATFIPGWIENLSQPDTPPFLPIPLLPILMGGIMFLQQKIQSKGAKGQAQQQQKMMMYFMPIMFTFIFLKFPSGLVLYWFVYNTVSFIQTTMIKSQLKNQASSLPEGNQKLASRNSRFSRFQNKIGKDNKSVG